ncbi:unnamed protein product [Discula destructiva]
MVNLSTISAVLALATTALAQCGAGSPAGSVTGSGSSYTATVGSQQVYSGSNYLAAVQGALDAISSGQRVAVIASGSIGAGTISLGSGKILEGCGTINVGYRAGRGAIESLNTKAASIPYLRMTGSPYFGLRFYGTQDLSLGQITMDLSGGMGIRFDRDQAANTNVKMGTITVTGGSSHAVETWNIDGLRIGSVIARNMGESGLLLQNSKNVRVGLVDGSNVGAGTGYGTLRFANTNGKMGNGGYSTNVYIDKVKSRGGGRGVFCVSESGGAQITEIDLADNGSNAILIENCYNVSILGGKVVGGGEVRISARSEFANTRDISITAQVTGTSVRESPCGTNITWKISGNAAQSVC